jgi:hypothetical protein
MSSAMPTTDDSAMPGCRAKRLSTSAGKMFSPPQLIMSSARPVKV